MKILITGSRGQLGRELLKQLREGSSEIGPLPREYTDCQVTGVGYGRTGYYKQGRSLLSG